MGPSANGPSSLIFFARVQRKRGRRGEILPLQSPQKPVLPPPLHLLPQRRKSREIGGPFPVQPEHASLCSCVHRLFLNRGWKQKIAKAEDEESGSPCQHDLLSNRYSLTGSTYAARRHPNRPNSHGRGARWLGEGRRQLTVLLLGEGRSRPTFASIEICHR